MKKPEKKLLNYFQQLTSEAQTNLLDYAEFLYQRHAVQEEIPTKPLDIPRPEEESVIAAIKRLSTTYPMIDKDKIFHETSGLMSQHVIQGKDPAEVIDELEALFRQYYTAYQENSKQRGEHA